MNHKVDNNQTERKKEEKTLRELWNEAYGSKYKNSEYFDNDTDDYDKNKDWYD